MIRKQNSFLIKFIYILIDVVVGYFCIFAACFIREGTLPFDVTIPGIFFDQANPFRFVFVAWLLSIIVLNNSYGLYRTRREVLESIEVWVVFKSICLASLVVVVGFYILKIHGFPRTVFGIAILLMIFSLSVWRIFKRQFVEYLVARGYNNVNAVIVGAGKVGTTLAAEIRKKPGLGIRIVGFLDDFKENDPQHKGIKIIGKVSDFVSVARREFVHKVFITIHNDNEAFTRLLEEARDLGILVRVIPQGFELTSCEFFKYNIGFIPVLEYSDTQNFRRQAGKRLFDICLGLVILACLIPFFIVMGIIIKLDSRGPVFYKSRRYGRRGQIFRMLKFRSMVHDAEKLYPELKHKSEVDGPIFKMKNDPRITRVGRFLRRYSLDELPQIINVLKGEMSLVGPRPLPIDQIEKEDLRQLTRLEVRPGITGLWQIRGRSDIAFGRLLRWDIWYINNWSLWLDINIILQTIPVVLHGKGAY